MDKILERKSLVTLVLVVLFLVILITLILFVTEPTYCDSKSCIEAADYIWKTINPSVKICDNFYNFTCGKSQSKQTSVTAFLKQLISEDVSINDTRSFRLQKQFYHSCIDVRAIDLDENKHFLQVLEKIGGWPVISGNNWNESGFDFTEFMVELRENGLQHDWFLDISIYSNWGDLTVLEINVPDSANKITNEEAYIDLMTRIAMELGAHENGARIQMEQVTYFEQKLEKLVEEIQRKNEEQRRERPLQLTTIADVQKKWQKLNWLELINHLTHQKLKDEQFVAFYVEQYMPQLDKLLKVTSKRTQVNYLVWKIVETYTPFLTRNIRDLMKNFSLVTDQADLWYGDREAFCFEEAKSYFRYTLQAAYLRKHVPEEKKRHVEDIIITILEELEQHVREIPWMNNEVRRVAISKIENVSYIIGGPEEMYYAEEFDKNFEMEKIDLSSTNLIPIAIQIYNRTLESMYNKKRPETNFFKNTFYATVTTKEVIFYPELNLLWVPAGSLHNFLYEQDRPNALNFGAIGSTIAYELVHGLYSAIYQHLLFGTNNTLIKFNEAISCLENCTNGLPEYKKVECSENVLETISDHLAVNLSYKAYLKWLKHNGPETHLKSLFFSNKQLFWLAYGTSMCVPELNSIRVFQSFRVFSAVHNSPNFRQDFRCTSNVLINCAF